MQPLQIWLACKASMFTAFWMEGPGKRVLPLSCIFSVGKSGRLTFFIGWLAGSFTLCSGPGNREVSENFSVALEDVTKPLFIGSCSSEVPSESWLRCVNGQNLTPGKCLLLFYSFLFSLVSSELLHHCVCRTGSVFASLCNDFIWFCSMDLGI